MKGARDSGGSASVGGLISDSANNLYCAGSVYDPAAWGTDTVRWGNTTSRTDAFLYKLSASGSLIWARFAGGSQHDYGNAIVLTSDGAAAYVAGYSASPDSMNFGSFKRAVGGVFTLFVAKTSTAALQVTDFIPKASFPVTLSPNPATDVLTARVPEDILLREVLVADLTGQIRIQLSGTATHGSEIRIPVSLLPAGQYFLLLRAQNGQQSVQSFIHL
ncbi:MAG: hypothetical protein EOP52_02430 [Sphingobacteriales bacterium]|nr:MAG: hypothetical protein EOP52_02430 [Sphingobacteriales bacterium]